MQELESADPVDEGWKGVLICDEVESGVDVDKKVCKCGKSCADELDVGYNQGLRTSSWVCFCFE